MVMSAARAGEGTRGCRSDSVGILRFVSDARQAAAFRGPSGLSLPRDREIYGVPAEAIPPRRRAWSRRKSGTDRDRRPLRHAARCRSTRTHACALAARLARR